MGVSLGECWGKQNCSYAALRRTWDQVIGCFRICQMSFGWPASQGMNEQFSYWAPGLAGLLMNFAGSGLSQIYGLFRSILAILEEKKVEVQPTRSLSQQN